MRAHGVILAGGLGTRFWPISRAARPKQFLDMLSLGKSLLQATYERLCKLIPAENIWVVGSRQHAELLKAQLPTLPPSHILLEPFQRNTAPSILWAAALIQAQDPEAVLWIVPADHYIPQEEALLTLIQKIFAQCALRRGIYTVGIRPTYPHTGYGYIQYLPSPSEAPTLCRKVKTFTEKPSRALAEVFLQSGDFLWNSGMFIAKAAILLEAYTEHAPEMYELLSKSATFSEELLLERFQHCPSISFDYAIMEKYREVYVVEGSFQWWDLGSWEALYRVSPSDAHGNVIHGQVLTEAVSNSLLYTQQPSRLMYVVGLDAYLVLDTEDALLILPRSEEEQHIRGIVGRLKAEGKTPYL